MTVGMLVAGGLEYALAARQLSERTLQESLKGLQAQVLLLEQALTQAPDPARRGEVVAAQLRQVRGAYGTLSAVLFDAEGRPVQAADPAGAGAELVDLAAIARVVASGRSSVEVEAEEGEAGQSGRYEFLLPVRTSSGTLVLEVDQDERIIRTLLEDLGTRRALGLLLAVLLALPLSYLAGGRALHRQHLQVAHEADTDELTGLAGRRPFRPLLEDALAGGQAGPVALALVDLDDFKQVNDTLGHSYGDRVLVALAASFQALRPTDRAFRLGGDEFAVALPGSDDDEAMEVLRRVRRSFATLAPSVTFSCGIASSPPESPLALQELWERSDAALYEAKRRGRHQTVTFGQLSSRHTVSAAKLDAVTELLADDSAVSVVFQPIWDLRRGVVLAHEALLRLPPGSCVDGPQEAFVLAQRLGLAARLDGRARQAVLAALRGRVLPGLLFLDVHPDALPDLDVDALVGELAAVGLGPADVVLEVSEQAGLDDPQPVRVLRRAHELGFRLALDDMGQGSAGLRALTCVRFDVVKLDRRVVARLGADPASAATMAAAVAFVQQTGGWFVAEGVEDGGMLEAVLDGASARLAGEPVLAGQGHLLGRPQAEPVDLDGGLPPPVAALVAHRRVAAATAPTSLLGQ